MRRSAFSLLLRLAPLVALAACSHSGAVLLPAAGSNAEKMSNAAPVYKVLYSFKGTPDGEHPAADVLLFKGNLYGTTTDGGGTGCYKSVGCGTVFELGPLGREERVIYRFRGGSDGSHPYATLIAIGNTFYGTTRSGGGSGCGGGGCGTVFSVTGDGTEHILYAFKGGSDGSNPVAGLVAFKHTLYGTTEYGGNAASPCSGHCGTVFAYDLDAGTEYVVHSFSGAPDGAQPLAALIVVNGEFYGTTEFGGHTAFSLCYSGLGCGTIFKVDPAGNERVLTRFVESPSNPYAAFPAAPLTYADGVFSGSTTIGGGTYYGGPHCGSVFGVAGYIFSCYYDRTPHGVLVVKKVVYGTTEDPVGAVYKLKGYTKVNLHLFNGGNDGANPAGGLISGPAGLLYGTTLNGGGNGCHRQAGCGTVFALSP